jgi:hypothetical protein
MTKSAAGWIRSPEIEAPLAYFMGVMGGPPFSLKVSVVRTFGAARGHREAHHAGPA